MADVGDLVLLYMNEQPTSFARIEEIAPDSKKGWCQVHLLLLQLPIVQVTWILKREYIDGSEFTMNGRRMRVELVKPPEHRDRSVSENAVKKKNLSETKVISIFEKRQKEK